MHYTNELTSFLSYDVIGEVSLNILEFKEKGDTLTFTGKISEIFYEDFLNKMFGGIPRLLPQKHALNLKLVSIQANRIVRNITVLITDVITYETDEDYNSCRITVKYARIPTGDTDPRSLTTIHPVVSHIFHIDGFIGLTIEGDMKAIIHMASQELRVFCHGGVVYYNGDLTMLSTIMEDEPTIDSIRYNTIGILTASALKIPVQEEYKNFKDAFKYFVKNIYGLDNIADI